MAFDSKIYCKEYSAARLRLKTNIQPHFYRRKEEGMVENENQLASMQAVAILNPELTKVQ